MRQPLHQAWCAEMSDRVALASLTECKGCLTSAAVDHLPPSQVQPQPTRASAPPTGSRNGVKEHGSRAPGTLTVGRHLQPREAPARSLSGLSLITII